jgi:hypothetical protein
MNTRRLFPLLIPLLVIGLVACSSGDGDSDDADSGPGSGSTSPAATTTTGNNPAPTVQTSTSPVTGQPTVATGGAATATEACALVTREEAATGLGEAVQAGIPFTLGSQTVGPGVTVSISSCTFDSATGRTVSVAYWRAAGTGASQLRQAIEQVVCVGKERVTGLGDFACWYDSDRKELQIVKGAGFVDVQITGASGDRSAALRTLAERALGRMP